MSLNFCELNLLRSKDLKFLHPSNLIEIEITLDVSKLFNDNEVKLEHSWKSEAIMVAYVVNLETSKLVKDEQFLNILFKDSTFFVLNLLMSKLVKDTQSENISNNHYIIRVKFTYIN